MAPADTAWPRWSAPGTRDAEEIGRVLEVRADRAIRHFERLARGGTPRLCPCCGYEGRFAPVRHKPETWCPQCDSRPRHRLVRLWMDRHLGAVAGLDVLHFAAEPVLGRWFEERGARYRTADINDRFDLRLDLEAIALPDASVDLVMAHHVLEHLDDARALAEIARILRPGGRAALTVPLVAGWEETYEDPTLDEAARALRYGDPDHRRFYGRDFAARIAAAGLAVDTVTAVEPDVSAHALQRGETLFIGTKRPDPTTKGDHHG